MVTSAFVGTERDLDSGIKVNRQAARQQDERFASRRSWTSWRPVGVSCSGWAPAMYTAQEELTSVLRQFDNKADGAFVRVADGAPFAMAAAAIQACKTANFSTVAYVPLETDN